MAGVGSVRPAVALRVADMVVGWEETWAVPCLGAGRGSWLAVAVPGTLAVLVVGLVAGSHPAKWMVVAV